MALETFDNQIDIRDLNLNEPEPVERFSFNPEEEIMPEQWQELRRYLVNMYKENEEVNDDLWYNLAMFRIVSPERFAQLPDIAFLWQKAQRRMESDWAHLMDYGPTIRLAFPEHFGEFFSKFMPDAVGRFAAKLKQYEQTGEWGRYFDTAYSAAVLIPEVFFTFEAEDIMAQAIKLMRETTEDPSYQIVQAYRAKFIFGKNARQLIIPQEAIDTEKYLFEKALRDGAYYTILSEGAALTIIAADEVKQTKHGLELVYDRRETAKKETPPEGRKF